MTDAQSAELWREFDSMPAATRPISHAELGHEWTEVVVDMLRAHGLDNVGIAGHLELVVEGFPGDQPSPLGPLMDGFRQKAQELRKRKSI